MSGDITADDNAMAVQRKLFSVTAATPAAGTAVATATVTAVENFNKRTGCTNWRACCDSSGHTAEQLQRIIRIWK